MTQIRETIESLCVVLKYNGIAEITAETFRLAKFDNQETTKAMWFTLKNLILWLEVMKDGMTVDFNGENGIVSEELPGLVRYCKHGMFSIGYRVRSFFALPENMENGSREILLGIGWLMAKEKLIKKFATRAKKITSEDLPFKESSCTGIPHIENSLILTGHSKATNEKERLLRLIEGIISLKGKLNATLRSLLAAKNEYSCVLNRIHRATLPFPQKLSSSSSHLSAIDVYLLYHEKELIRHQESLEYENIYLRCLIFLMDKESSFWKWMESTLDAKIKDNEENPEEDEIQEPWTLSNVDYKPSKDIQGIKTQQVEFSKLLQKQESSYFDVSTKWKRYKNAVEESKEMQEEFLDVLSYLDQEVLAELNTIENDVNENSNLTAISTSVTTTPLSSLQGPLKFVTPNLQQKKKHRSIETNVNEQSAVAGVIQELSEKDELLKQELLNLKKEHDDSMVKFSLNLKDIVCIPPNLK